MNHYDPWDMTQQHVSDEGCPEFDSLNSWLAKLEWLTLAWAGEVGEVCNVVKKIRRDDGGFPTNKRREDLESELVDSAVYLLVLLDHIGVPMSAMRERIEEAHKRFLNRRTPPTPE